MFPVVSLQDVYLELQRSHGSLSYVRCHEYCDHCPIPCPLHKLVFCALNKLQSQNVTFIGKGQYGSILSPVLAFYQQHIQIFP